MKVKQIDEKAALRAFVMPELYPFLLEVYKDETALNEDIKKAREAYKQLVALEKQKSKPSTHQSV